MKKKKNILFVGTEGFPYGLAGVQKAILISKCLALTGNSISVVCRKGIHSLETYPDLKAHGDFQGIEYIYTSGYPFRSPNFFRRNLLKVKGAINEILLFRKRKKDNEQE